ncbi:MAG: hypothetical protein FJY88_08415 [Candidatus Eisenbacteria bacterium]|nr:hypothetical protein [Candidatus Eisenbacteria bacterium]
MNTRSFLWIAISLLLMASSAQGCNNKVQPPTPDGAVMGIVTAIEKTETNGLGWTVYSVQVVQDSSYTGVLTPAARGETIHLRTPGVDGWAEVTYPGWTATTVSMSRDETIRTQYIISSNGSRIPTVKYTVWKKGLEWQRQSSAIAATNFESWLMDSRNIPAFGDSLQLYASTWVPEVFADPIPNSDKHPQLNWLTAYGSLMISPGNRIGTLREVKQKEAVSMERR